ncbi:MAG: iron-sulfur cluster assembly protein [candidate division Zixibacteria bacterium]|nr:iron-sulfur cluster assembly protein [candidate division Zixibacteria bacterium]
MPLPTVDEIREVIKPINDPEIRVGIVDLGLIYDIIIDNDGKVEIKMTLTTPACPFGEMLIAMVHREVEKLDGVSSVKVILVWDPVWDPKEMCSDAAKDILGIW